MVNKTDEDDYSSDVEDEDDRDDSDDEDWQDEDQDLLLMESTAEIARDILEGKHRNTDNSTSDWSEVMVVEMKLWTYQICKLECVSRAMSINSPILNGV